MMHPILKPYKTCTAVLGEFRVTSLVSGFNHLQTPKEIKRYSDMDLFVATLFLGLFLGMLTLIPLMRRSDQRKCVQSTVSPQGSKAYPKFEVSLHNKRTDCWIIIKEKVYDVTSYVEEHPGGDAILAHAGDDSTEGFFGPQHATRVFDMIEDFYIGDLVKN